jgi:haloalkane dehalogenase
MATIPRNKRDQGSLKTQTAAPRPAWLDSTLYPFKSHFVEIEGHRIHYLDEGSGPTLLFLHPSIGWSFTYREMIRTLRADFRCIALDFPGFGLSTAAPGFQHTLIGDARLVERFMEALELTSVTLFAQDLATAIGLGVVARRPEWFRAVAVSNSFAWPLDEYPGVYRFVRVVASSPFRALIVNFNLLVRLFVTYGEPGRKFSEGEKRGYLGPTARRSLRRHQSDLFRSAVNSHDYLADLRERLLRQRDLPAFLAFGSEDATFKAGWLTRFEQVFPRHRSLVIKGANHFPQEYDGAGLAAALRAWWQEEVEPLPPELRKPDGVL